MRLDPANIRERLAHVQVEVRENYPLAPLTTYQVGGAADCAILPANTGALAATLGFLSASQSHFVVLGGGSNVLVSDRGVREPVILTERLSQCRCLGDRPMAQAGVRSHDVAHAAASAALSGAEFLSWLPGSVGGACFMNASAYGSDMSKVLVGAHVIHADGRIEEIDVAPSDFQYKRSPFSRRGLVVAEATLQLRPGSIDAITAQMTLIEKSRREKHEMDYPSCGCVFKNNRAHGQPAGKLIDSLGLRGFSIGGAQVSPWHANFVINRDHASADDIAAVIHHIREQAEQRLGLQLEHEVCFLGEW